MREFVVARQRQRDDCDRDLRQAWHTAYLQRVKDFPALKTLLTRNPTPERQNVSALRSTLHVLSAQYGYPLKARKKAKHGV